MLVRLSAPLVFGALLGQVAFAAETSRLYRESSDALYNLDFSTALQGFEELTRQYPDNPDYWNALASTLWLKILFDQQKLNLDAYSSSNTFGSRDSRDTISKDEEKRLRDAIAMAINKANVALARDSKDVRALYALGASNGTLASFESTAKRSYYTAYTYAKAARDYHQRVLKLDPNFDDARMDVGIFDYVVSVVPSWFRLSVGLFMGMNGDGKEAGIQKIQTAAARGNQVTTDARMVLIVIYNREHRYDEALKLIDELHSKYPRNFMFEMSRASVYGKMKKWDQATLTYEKLLQEISAHRNGYERLRVARVNSELGRSQVEQHLEDKAVVTFEKVAGDNGATPNEKADAHLWMGKVYDAKKDRNRALEHYKAVLGLDCDPSLKREAEAFRRKPFGM
jgi:tetratricopeptide (TPR) repeat protein